MVQSWPGQVHPAEAEPTATERVTVRRSRRDARQWFFGQTRIDCGVLTNIRGTTGSSTQTIRHPLADLSLAPSCAHPGWRRFPRPHVLEPGEKLIFPIRCRASRGRSDKVRSELL